MKEKTENCLEDRGRGAKEVVCWRLDRRRLEEGEEEVGCWLLLECLQKAKKKK